MTPMLATLKSAGVPIGPSGLWNGSDRGDGSPDLHAVVEALASLAVSSLSSRERVAVAAWLGAWKAEWPSSFRQRLGLLGELRLRELRVASDENQYLKLRRIAAERLARVI